MSATPCRMASREAEYDMRPKQYVIPQLLPHHEAPASDAALDATEWASRIAALRARVQMLSVEHLAYYLPRFDFTDLMGLVVCPPYSVELQAQIAKVLFPKFLEDGFSRHCIRCGEHGLASG